LIPPARGLTVEGSMLEMATWRELNIKAFGHQVACSAKFHLK
jgi:hypothetical protein